MKFWRENKISGEFELPVAEAAEQFVAWARGPVGGQMISDGIPVGRLLRWWLSSAEYLNSAWVDETGPESYGALEDLVLETLFD